MAVDRDKSSSSLLQHPNLPVMNLKKQLRYYLELKELSAAQLAKKASVPKQSLSGWLSGNTPRDLNQVKRIANTLGVSVDNLLFGEGSDQKAKKEVELDALLGEAWVGGLFEIKLRRVRK